MRPCVRACVRACATKARLAQVGQVLRSNPSVFGTLGRAGALWTFVGYNSI